MSSAPPSYTLNPSVVVSDDEPASKVPRTDPINIQGASGPSSLLSVPVTPRPRSITPVRLSSSVERPRSIARMNDQGRQEFIVRKKKLVASATTAIRKKIDKFDQIKDTAEDRNITEMYGELNELYADILNFYGTYKTNLSEYSHAIDPADKKAFNEHFQKLSDKLHESIQACHQYLLAPRHQVHAQVHAAQSNQQQTVSNPTTTTTTANVGRKLRRTSDENYDEHRTETTLRRTSAITTANETASTFTR